MSPLLKNMSTITFRVILRRVLSCSAFGAVLVPPERFREHGDRDRGGCPGWREKGQPGAVETCREEGKVHQGMCRRAARGAYGSNRIPSARERTIYLHARPLQLRGAVGLALNTKSRSRARAISRYAVETRAFFVNSLDTL